MRYPYFPHPHVSLPPTHLQSPNPTIPTNLSTSLKKGKVKMGCGVGPHSARLSHRPHRMPFRLPQSNNCCILLQREMGSERPLWMFLLNHAECVTIGQDDKRTKRKSDAQMQRNNQDSYRHYMAIYVFGEGKFVLKYINIPWHKYMHSSCNLNRW